MFIGLKNFLNGPSTGIKNIEQLGTYLKANGLSFAFIIIVIMLVGGIIKTLLGGVGSLFGRY